LNKQFKRCFVFIDKTNNKSKNINPRDSKQSSAVKKIKKQQINK